MNSSKLQVVTANAFIHQVFEGEEKVFLPKRAVTKKFLPNVYELPGGHIDFGEDLETGLKREIREEFCMEIKVGDLFYAFTYFNEYLGAHSFGLMYFATFQTPLTELKLMDHSEFGWFGVNELDKVASLNRREDDPTRKVLEKGFALLSGSRPDFG